MKKISFLITGDELLHGDIQDTNTAFFAKRLQNFGGIFFQHVHSSDNKNEIVQAITYLLTHSDIIITTGGLGPTSDDCTRFAVADALNKELCINSTALTHIEDRLKMFAIKMTEANKQQALFPQDAILLPNENGSAYGCYILHGSKAVFMLPGPPRENQPMFEQYVVPQLKKLSAFQEIYREKWLTLGLIEGEIAPAIDAAINELDVKTGYRWSYPYLEIKIATQSKAAGLAASKIIEKLLEGYIVSKNEQLASAILAIKQQDFSKKVNCFEQENKFELRKLLPDSSSPMVWLVEENLSFPCFYVAYGEQTDTNLPNRLSISCRGYIDNICVLDEKDNIPNRGPEIKIYVKEYVAWKLLQFFEKINSSD